MEKGRSKHLVTSLPQIRQRHEVEEFVANSSNYPHGLLQPWICGHRISSSARYWVGEEGREGGSAVKAGLRRDGRQAGDVGVGVPRGCGFSDNIEH
jgi:hypothetical protein